MASNHHEAMRRRAKTEKLCATIHARAQKAGYTDPAEIARILRHMASARNWQDYADAAGVRLPSPTTRDAVIATFEGRAEAGRKGAA